MTSLFPLRKTVLAALLGILFVIGFGPILIQTTTICSFDQKLYEQAQFSPHSPLIKTMKVVTHLGDGETFFAFAILFCLGAFFYLGPKPFFFTFSGFLLVRIITWVLKESVERVRPVSSISWASGFSFPSGQATNIAFLSVILYWFLEKKIADSQKRKWFFLFLCILVIAVGASRILLEVHWFSDVVAGYILGFSLGIIMKEWGLRRKNVWG